MIYLSAPVTISGGTVSATTGYAVYNDFNGKVTVSGTAKVTSANTTATQGTIYRSSSGSTTGVQIEITGGTVENTGSGNAVYNSNYSCEVSISGGTVSATTGVAVYNASYGKITVSQAAGATTKITSANVTNNRGTIFLADSGTTVNERLTISGGTVENTSTGYAVYNASTGTVSITGTPTVGSKNF